jgi:hypothetical protein
MAMKSFVLTATLMAGLIALLPGTSSAQQRDCGASGLGCKSADEIEWVNKAGEIFPNGSGMAHRAFGYYCARHPQEQHTCLTNPWVIVGKLKMERSAFDQSL